MQISSLNPSHVEVLGAMLFVAAVVHTFLTGPLRRLALRFPDGSFGENFFHWVGEVELVFGIWAGVLCVGMFFLVGWAEAIAYVEGLSFTEPLFVFAIMTAAATRPVIEAARALIAAVARLLPLPREQAIYLSCLVVGPLLGSCITEPAAMTVTALLLRDRYYTRGISPRFAYTTLAVLFVNISIGGVLTHFAAPPVLMVAGKWGWDTPFMLAHFGGKAVIAVLCNAGIAALVLRRELRELKVPAPDKGTPPPWWLVLLHLLFLALIVVGAHHPVVFLGALFLFLGLTRATQEYQTPLQLGPSLLVAFFLAGLVVLGAVQRWWLEPLLAQLSAGQLFLGTTALTAITDNAALTFLGAQVENISEFSKYALVAGAVAGGGLTVIANAPNPAGFAILQESFGDAGISPLRLFFAACIPTLVAMACLWFF